MNCLSNNIFSKFFNLISLLGFRYFVKLLSKNLYSKDYYFILQKKLGDDQSQLKKRLQYKLNTITEIQIKKIISDLPFLDIEARKEVLVRLEFFNAGFRNCFVATNSKDEIMYIQWIIYPTENKVINDKYSSLFWELNQNQVMLENAFTFPKYRGFQLYSQVTIDLMNKAKDEDYKSCIVYVKSDNIIALNELKNIGYTITKRIPERKLFGITKRNLG